MARFNPTKEDLSENPPTPENLIRGFHGRPVQHKFKTIVPIEDYDGAVLLGRSTTIYYKSDKRDPKDPKGEGAQGFMKVFYHDQDPDSYLFAIPVSSELDNFQEELAAQCVDNKLLNKVRKKNLIPQGDIPTILMELGHLDKVILDVGESDPYTLTFHGFRLYVADDMRTLFGLPFHNGKFLDTCVYVWKSNHTKVNWRGIID